MAASTPLTYPLLSHKQRKAASRKERRKRRRQAIAKARDCGLVNESPDENEGEVNVTAQEESLRLHEEWLERERQAQEVFRLKFEREEAIRKHKEEEERLIREEWEAQQKKEQEEKEQKLQKKRDREEAVQKMLDEAESQLANTVPWMNPEAPAKQNSENYGTERDVAHCPFFLKTGACRFGDRCSRKHVYPMSSPTLMIRGMFVTFGMEEARRDDYDGDAFLEHSEEDLLESFTEFYRDVLPEFRSVGKVVQFKVSCNHEPHLRGNVYVQFETEEQCKQAFIKFNGRWYAGRQLHCEICPVTRWKNAICGLFDRRKCPKGKNCNFLHVFRNPGNEFWEADRDMSPDRSVRGSRRDGWNSERNTERSWRTRQGSRSPVRSERSHSRRQSNSWRSRSRSRERRSSNQHRSERWSTRSRHSVRGREQRSWSKERDRKRSRERSRSRERDRKRSKERSRSRDRDQDRNRNGSKGRSQSRERNRKRSKDRSQSRDRDRRSKERSQSRERDRDGKKSRGEETKNGEEAEVDKSVRSRSQSREASPKQQEGKEKPQKDRSNGRRHKHSKKSKKKHKKKHKRKEHSSEKGSSSAESDMEKESETETSQNHVEPSNDQDSKPTEDVSPKTVAVSQPGE